MTSLDPSHIPGLHLTSDRSTGQAVHTSVPAEAEGEASGLRSLSERLAEMDRRRRDGAGAKKESRRKTESEDGEREEGDRVPVPPIPDLRFEQGVLSSLRPFIHRLPTSSTTSASLPSSEEKKTAVAEKTALATTSLTAEGPGQAGDAEVDVFDLKDGVRVEWSRVGYVLMRDQVVFPLLQGILWAVGGYYLSALWSWNRARVDARAHGLPRPSLLKSLGIRAGL